MGIEFQFFRVEKAVQRRLTDHGDAEKLLDLHEESPGKVSRLFRDRRDNRVFASTRVDRYGYEHAWALGVDMGRSYDSWFETLFGRDTYKFFPREDEYRRLFPERAALQRMMELLPEVLESLQAELDSFVQCGRPTPEQCLKDLQGLRTNLSQVSRKTDLFAELLFGQFPQLCERDDFHSRLEEQIRLNLSGEPFPEAERQFEIQRLTGMLSLVSILLNSAQDALKMYGEDVYCCCC